MEPYAYPYTYHYSAASASHTLELTIKVSDEHENSGGALSINFIGLQEKGMWPWKKSVMQEEGGGSAAMRMFEQLDGWLDKTSGGTVDALLMGMVFYEMGYSPV
ncbi:hypothetical protein DFP72DRAFT_1062513 [Ephemerocybe angulata]|uniref:Uncharacterized protein n=1 Tax=Ephemerocybe angulata TaxID=980116 RepID=A0A8H6ME85_9AGAR|nr:hypothetical protein DFP72DRAFT_1062513 [Tulosesus angulatus]